MNISKKLIFALIMIFFTSFGFSKNIVVACMQNSDAFELSDKVTSEFEGLLFEALFDSGYIVTSTPVFSSDEHRDNIESVKKCLESPSEYILLVNLVYSKEGAFDIVTNNKFANLESLAWKLVKYSNEKVLSKGSKKFRKIETKTELDKELNLISLDILKLVQKKTK